MSSGSWEFIAPIESVNLVLNPLVDGTGGYSTSNGTLGTTETSVKGRYALEWDPNLVSSSFTVSFEDSNLSGPAYISFFASRDEEFEISIDGDIADLVEVREMGSTDLYASSPLTWYRHIYKIDSANLTGGSMRVDPGVPVDILFDCFQIESYFPTTFISGDEVGDYEWLGERHNSASIRYVSESLGGKIIKASGAPTGMDDLSFNISRATGTSMPPISVLNSNAPQRAGGVHKGTEVGARAFELRGQLTVTGSHDDFQTARGNFARIVSGIDQKPRRLYYWREGGARYIDYYYESGLQGTQTPQVGTEDINLRLIALDPYWTGVGEYSSVVSGHAGGGGTPGLLGSPDGDWQIFPTANMSGNADVFSLLWHHNRLYIGGDFLNLDSRSDADYWSWMYKDFDASLGDYATNADLPTNTTGIVYDMFVGPGGDVIMCADNGVFAVDQDGAYNASALGSPSPNANGAVRKGLVDLEGRIWIVGDFSSIDGVSAMGIAYYDGSTWVAPYGSVTGTGDILDIAMTAGGYIYVAPETTSTSFQLDGASGHLLRYDGTWSGGFIWPTEPDVCNWMVPYGSELIASFGVNGSPRIYKIDESIDMDDFVGTQIAEYEAPTGSSGDQIGRGFIIDGILYVTRVDAISDNNFGTITANGFAAYYPPFGDLTGFVPILPDIDTTYTTHAIVKNGPSIYLGGDFPGTAIDKPGLAVTYYNASGPGYPVISFEKSSGAEAYIHGVYSPQTGAQIVLKPYLLADGEVVTIDTRPGRYSVTSSTRGDLSSQIVPISDIRSFEVDPPSIPHPQYSGSTTYGEITRIVPFCSGSGSIDVHVAVEVKYLGQD